MTDKTLLWEEPHPLAVIAGDDHSPIPVLLVSPSLAMATGTAEQVREWHATLSAGTGCRVLAAPAEVRPERTFVAPVAAVETHRVDEHVVLTVELDAGAYDTSHLQEDAEQLCGRMYAALDGESPAEPPADWYDAVRDAATANRTFPFSPTDQIRHCAEDKKWGSTITGKPRKL